MFTKQLSIALAFSVCIGLGVARPDLKTFAAAPISATKIDFDQAFADPARQRDAVYVNRAHKGDRLPSIKTVLPEPALLPNCEPVASLYADLILGRIVGRCAA
jgi:hypothetical protein